MHLIVYVNVVNIRLQEKLDKEKQKNVILQNELELLKSEMVDVKSRNKTLCGILGHGESERHY